MERPNSPVGGPVAAGGTGAPTPSPGPAPGDEFSVIGRLRATFEAGPGPAPDGQVWIGDDAAVLAAPSGPHLLATDLVVGGVHADPAVVGLDDLGWKAVMAAVSDLAAMGGRPDHLLVSVAAPQGTDLDRLAAGVAAAAGAVGAPVVGGDLSGSATLVVSVAVSGSLRGPAGPGPLLRSGARPGDTVVLTGPLGASAAGLRLLRRRVAGGAGLEEEGRSEDEKALAVAHLRPVPRLAEGEAARLAGAHAAVDVSDGLAADLRHLAGASGVGIDLVEVPAAPGATPDEALGGGEEYELVVATPDPDTLRHRFAAAGLRPPLVVGVCTDRAEVLTLAGAPLPEAGWRHELG